jgi:transposase
MTEPILGIDISKLKFNVCLINSSGKLKHRVFPNTVTGFEHLLDWLSKQGIERVHAGLEATGTYGETLSLFLHEAGDRVSVVNPAAIKAFAGSRLSRTKTDRVEAELIARFCHAQAPPAWTPVPTERRELQALVRRFESLIGIAETTAALLLSEMRDITQYRSARQVAAYAGLVPRERQSGSSVRGRTRLSKIGNARLRRALYFPAITALRCSEFFQSWAKGLQERGKSKMSVICAVMGKLVHVAYGVLKNGKEFDPQWAKSA